MRLRAVQTARLRLPDLSNLSDRFWDEVKKIAEDAIVDNIERQRQADGRPIKPNPEKTRKRKQKAGRGTKSLMDKEHRFVQKSGGSWKGERATFRGKQTVKVTPATAELRKLNMYVQRNGYDGWLGFSADAYREIKLALREELRRQFRAAGRR